MRYRFRAAASVLGTVFLAGCPDTTGPARQLDVGFQWGVDRPQTEPAFVVAAGTGELTIRGYYETACSGYSTVGRASMTDRRITLSVDGRQPDPCPRDVAPVGYQAIIRDIPAGTYDVSVVHNHPVSNATKRHYVGLHVVR